MSLKKISEFDRIKLLDLTSIDVVKNLPENFHNPTGIAVNLFLT